MRPIENLWDVVERFIHIQDPAPSNTMELWAAIEMSWFNNGFNNLISHGVATLHQTRGSAT